MYRQALLLIAAVFVLAGPLLAQQSEGDIRRLLEQRDRDIKSLVGSDDNISGAVKEQLRDVINGMIDFESMGEQALGRYWGDLTPAQKTEFIDTFSQIVRTQSLASLEVYRAKVTYDDISIEGTEAHVVTTTTYKDVPTKVEYLLRYKADNWVATDIVLDQVSTVEGYARSFQSVIRKKGFDELMKKLHQRLDESESKVS